MTTTFKDYEKALEIVTEWEANRGAVHNNRQLLKSPRLRLLNMQRELMYELESKRALGDCYTHNWYIDSLRKDIIKFTRAIRAHESKF